MTARPLLLLPPSKGKQPGGDGPAYRRTLRARAPLTAARTRLLVALADDVPRLSDREVARLGGVAERDVPEVRATLSDLTGSRTLSAHRRYTGIVHGNAGLAAVDPDTAALDVRIVSPVMGLVALDEPVPAYRLEFAATLPSLGGLAAFWREAAADHLAALGAGVRVWDLLPGEHRRVWTAAGRAALDVVDVRFVRPDGRPANAARTKVAKGRLAAALLAEPAATPADVARDAALGVGWRLTVHGPVLSATFVD